jgi:hypothetical protein
MVRILVEEEEWRRGRHRERSGERIFIEMVAAAMACYSLGPLSGKHEEWGCIDGYDVKLRNGMKL